MGRGVEQMELGKGDSFLCGDSLEGAGETKIRQGGETARHAPGPVRGRLLRNDVSRLRREGEGVHDQMKGSLSRAIRLEIQCHGVR